MNFHHRAKIRHKDHLAKTCLLRTFSATAINKTHFKHTQDPMRAGVFECVEFENEFSFL